MPLTTINDLIFKPAISFKKTDFTQKKNNSSRLTETLNNIEFKKN